MLFVWKCIYTQGLLIPAQAVSTPYSYRTCVAYRTSTAGETYCDVYDIIEVESASLVPPFAYNNQCGSVVLTSYIPVFLLGHAIQLMLPLIVLTLVAYFPYNSLSPFVQKMLHGVIWPEFWLEAKHGNAFMNDEGGIMLKMSSIFCNDVFNNWLLMVTFGLCSPVLVLAVVCSVLMKMSMWVLLVGRFTRCMLHDEDSGGGVNCSEATTHPAATTSDATTSRTRVVVATALTVETTPSSSSAAADENRTADVAQNALTALAEEYIPLSEVLAGSFWRLVWCSALFVSLLGWDLAMDEVGWLQSMWVPLVPLCYVVLLRCAAHLYLHSTSARDSSKNSTQFKLGRYHLTHLPFQLGRKIHCMSCDYFRFL